MEEQSICLAMDIGGTKMLLGEVARDGRILNSQRYPSHLGKGATQQETLDQLLLALREYKQKNLSSTPICAALGVVGRVDHINGLWLEIEPTRCETLEVAAILTAELGIPCYINNDVRCALTAEQVHGWGKKTCDYIYINVGTGIAAGIVTRGHVVSGASFNAGEVGHMVVAMGSGIVCPCGRVGCAEAIAAGSGLDRRARALREQYAFTRLTFPENSLCDAAEIFRLAKEGDALCIRLACDAADAIAALVMNLVWASDPDTVVLGGGVASDDWMLGQIRQRLLPGMMRFVYNGMVTTDLNPHHIGLIGAGMMGFTAFDKLQLGE